MSTVASQNSGATLLRQASRLIDTCRLVIPSSTSAGRRLTVSWRCHLAVSSPRCRMAKTRIILQGLTTDSHIADIHRVFDLPDLKVGIISAAYVSAGGVALLKDTLTKHGKAISLYAGIRNVITSREALVAAFHTGVNLYTVDTGTMKVTFHPKLYYGRNEAHARLVVGSANLTPGGLNNNVEASTATDLDLADEEDAKLCAELEGVFDGLTGVFPQHIYLVKELATLDTLKSKGTLLDEADTVRPSITAGEAERSDEDDTPPIKLKTKPIFPVIAPRGAAQGAKTKATADAAEPDTAADEAPAGSWNYELVWESKPLTERDLTIPTQTNTNATGSMNLDKGLLPEEIDHRHYFYENVFSALPWTKKSNTVVEVNAPFEAVLKGVKIGTFNLRIGHTTSTDTASYAQRNAMTRLSWGPLKEHIQKTDLLGRTARLYRSVDNPTAFLIEID